MDPNLLTGLGAALSIFLTATGSAIASSHSGIFAVRGRGDGNESGASQARQNHLGFVLPFVPIIISGVLAIYGIIVSVLLVRQLDLDQVAVVDTAANKYDSSGGMTQEQGYRNLSAGLAVGLACLASGMGIANFMRQINDDHFSFIRTQTGTNPSSSTSRPSFVSSEQTMPLMGSQNENPRNLTISSHPSTTGGTPPNFMRLTICLCYLEAIGLYGLIVALFLMG